MGHLSAYIVLSQKTSAISKKRILRMYFVRGCLLHGWIGLLVVNVRQWKDSYRRGSYKGGEQHTVSSNSTKFSLLGRATLPGASPLGRTMCLRLTGNSRVSMFAAPDIGTHGFLEFWPPLPVQLSGILVSQWVTHSTLCAH